MPSTWATIVFWVLLVPLIIVMLVVYLRSRKFSRLVFILSVFTYAMTVMYWIDAYQLGRNSIVLLLVLSSLLMMFIGYLMHRQRTEKEAWGSWKTATGCMIIIAIIVALSASPIGWSVTSSAVSSVRLSDIQPVLEEGQPSYAKSIPIYTTTVTNTFIPRQYELPQATACLYNTEKQAYGGTNVFWDIQSQPSDFGQGLNTMEVGRESKIATLKTSSNPYYKPSPREAVPVKFEPQVWDKLYLFLNTGRTYKYIDCNNLQPEDLARAIKISITQD